MRKTVRNRTWRAVVSSVCAVIVIFAGCSIFDSASDDGGSSENNQDVGGQQQITDCKVVFYPNVPADVAGVFFETKSLTYNSGSDQLIPDGLFSLDRYGYHLAGWANSADANVVSYQVGDWFDVWDGRHLYAVWEKDTVNGLVIKDNVVVEFKSDSGITAVTIPDGVTAIGDRAFLECKNLASVTIPDGVTSVGSGAFCRCEGLTSVTLPESVMSIGDMAFSECPNLTIQYTGTRAQWETLRFETFGVPVVCADDSLGSENQPAVLTVQNRVVVKCDPSATGYIEIQPGVTEIAENAFDNCVYVKGVIIPEGVTKIGYGAFRFCSDMMSVQIPGSVTYIGDKAFEYCDRLETVNFTGSLSRLTTLGLDTKGFDIKAVSVTCYYGNYNKSGRCYYVERGDATLAGYVIIPSGVTEIAYEAFRDCKNIIGVGIPIDVTYIGDDAFKNCSSLTSIAISNMQAKFANDYNIKKRSYTGTITEWIKGGDHEWGVSEINEKPVSEITELAADDFAGITKIGSNTFAEWTGLKYVNIPNGITNIGEQAFSGCHSLKNVIIPDSVMTIGNRAFYDCSLKSVIIPNGVTSIGNSAFSGCTSLSSVIIPDGVSIIDVRAFQFTGVKSIEIPVSVISIKNNAFDSCKNLTNIVFKGTQEQWENIYKATGKTLYGASTDWDLDTGDYTVYCTDGNISKY